MLAKLLNSENMYKRKLLRKITAFLVIFRRSFMIYVNSNENAVQTLHSRSIAILQHVSYSLNRYERQCLMREYHGFHHPVRLHRIHNHFPEGSDLRGSLQLLRSQVQSV